ncbi:MAG: sigma-70 family RNA polymerase sigma factor [Kofleriaceae bacterium]
MERSDAELLAASQRGEREAFGALVERYQTVVCAVSYSRTGDRALSEDVAQDTFLAAWRQLHQLREVGRLRAWLCGIARNLARKARRRAARETPSEPVAMTTDDAATPFDHVSETESEQLVRDALARVPEIYRDALVLYYQEHHSARQVAQALDISEAAALQRLARGRQCLSDGVSHLVERSLRGASPRRSLVVGVLAALPALTPSHANATPSTHGGPMIKFVLVAAALTAAGTTAYFTTSHRASAPPVSTAVVAAAAPSAVHPAPPAAAAAPAPALVASSRAAAAPAQAYVPPVEPPRLDAATIARTRLYEGPSRGPADAPVSIAVFTDLQCHYCGQVLGALDQMIEDLPGKVRMVVKQMPVHKTAVLAAEAALAAQGQGRFWELHDLMLSHQEDLSRDAILALADQGDLDVAQLRRDLDAHTYQKALQAEIDAATEIGVQATPTFIVNGRNAGADPRSLRKVVDEELAALR